MLNIPTKKEDGKVLMALDGRLDTNTAPDFEAALTESLDGASALTLDLAGLTYISSAGLRVLLKAYKIMCEPGQLTVVNVSKKIMEVFEVTGFSDILTIE